MVRNVHKNSALRAKDTNIQDSKRVKNTRQDTLMREKYMPENVTDPSQFPKHLNESSVYQYHLGGRARLLEKSLSENLSHASVTGEEDEEDMSKKITCSEKILPCREPMLFSQDQSADIFAPEITAAKQHISDLAGKSDTSQTSARNASNLTREALCRWQALICAKETKMPSCPHPLCEGLKVASKSLGGMRNFLLFELEMIPFEGRHELANLRSVCYCSKVYESYISDWKIRGDLEFLDPQSVESIPIDQLMINDAPARRELPEDINTSSSSKRKLLLPPTSLTKRPNDITFMQNVMISDFCDTTDFPPDEDRYSVVDSCKGPDRTRTKCFFCRASKTEDGNI
ncbi:LAFE_0B01266g1_1 [Lachancea fermentati]|uniref:LAFE_0B01266g1_1 n=1 Tax=Lachancea fermentati TaxID=4955 RepID=A0A1G4M7B4_LACFM|nr:LAFE_0B01266g1_1 [Lachancea fermentati]